jgi:hypothetical protein
MVPLVPLALMAGKKKSPQKVLKSPKKSQKVSKKSLALIAVKEKNSEVINQVEKHHFVVLPLARSHSGSQKSQKCRKVTKSLQKS